MTGADIQFTIEGLSVTLYDDESNVVDETWLTWDEIEGLKSADEAHIILED